LEDQPRYATVVCDSDKVVVLMLERRLYQQVLAHAAPEEALPAKPGSKNTTRYEQTELSHVGLLGYGFSSTVSLVKYGATGKYYALKSMSKGAIVKNHQTQKVMREKMNMHMVSCPFIIKLVATFNNSQQMHLLLEPALGGDLFSAYSRQKNAKKAGYGHLGCARFYVGCIVRALTSLHRASIIFRNVQSENVVLIASGYGKLTGFGLSRFTLGRAHTLCGTPYYFAPEMLTGAGHTFAVDWWMLGVLAFELLTGKMPFDGDSPLEIFRRVNEGIESVSFPEDDAPWVDFVKGLCAKEPSERLAMRNGGVKNIETHPWYSGNNFDWKSLGSQTLKAPIQPQLAGPEDCSNFSVNASMRPVQIDYEDPGTNWDANFQEAGS